MRSWTYWLHQERSSSREGGYVIRCWEQAGRVVVRRFGSSGRHRSLRAWFRRVGFLMARTAAAWDGPVAGFDQPVEDIGLEMSAESLLPDAEAAHSMDDGQSFGRCVKRSLPAYTATHLRIPRFAPAVLSCAGIPHDRLASRACRIDSTRSMRTGRI